MLFKYRIRDLRREKGITASQLGEQLGLSRFAISHWENGDAYPPLDVCIKLCEIFDCSMDYLVGLSDIKKLSEAEESIDSNLINIFDKLSPESKNAVYQFTEFLSKKKH